MTHRTAPQLRHRTPATHTLTTGEHTTRLAWIRRMTDTEDMYIVVTDSPMHQAGTFLQIHCRDLDLAAVTPTAA